MTDNRESDLLAERCFQTVVQHLHGQSRKRSVRKNAWERNKDDSPRTGRVIYLLNAVSKRLFNIYLDRVVRNVYERTHRKGIKIIHREQGE